MKKLLIAVLLSSCINLKPVYIHNVSNYKYRHNGNMIYAKREKIIIVTTDTIKKPK